MQNLQRGRRDYLFVMEGTPALEGDGEAPQVKATQGGLSTKSRAGSQ